MNMLDELLYPIADTMQVRLNYQRKSTRIVGNRKVVLPLGSAELPCEVDAVSSFINEKQGQAGVLFHISGKLYLLVAYNHKAKQVSAFVISSSALGKRRVELVDSLPKLCNIKTAVKELSKGVKKAYTRSSNGQKWSEFDLPKDMR